MRRLDALIPDAVEYLENAREAFGAKSPLAVSLRARLADLQTDRHFCASAIVTVFGFVDGLTEADVEHPSGRQSATG